MGHLDGTVALITGAARGQGRAHAVRLARDGADVVAVDLCEQIGSVPYALATREDLDETVRLVEAEGRRVVPLVTDVRDLDALRSGVDAAVAELGPVGVVVANAGIAPLDSEEPDPVQRWHDVISVNLTGVWNTCQVGLPSMVAAGRGGSVVLTSSTAGLRGNLGGSAAGDAYVASKHALVGLARNLANHHARDLIRVNTIHPSGVATPMVENESLARRHAADPARAAATAPLLPGDLLQADDISEVVAWLCSPAARFLTGVALPVDAGYSAKA
ncbi:mycofactocin-coupled SDR family oxidoreductase [Nocardioides zeae]|uniref:Mycofactocin-coupled SDR family oxidoreductase n=1 Tax=Nocardioides imazamoxiresistens TaxID=3231893 RepID=A0ABU3PR40_9ACTN|nr:mycofactocin-coupled SDR family oxidoreductase [Nocardioides zeae]MDT9591673.1 mycofactocin-coupled SDR family oxidoreductase [Nocardioides zeae]